MSIGRALIVQTYQEQGTLRRAAKALGMSPQNVHRVVQQDAPEIMRSPHRPEYIMRKGWISIYRSSAGQLTAGPAIFESRTEAGADPMAHATAQVTWRELS